MRGRPFDSPLFWGLLLSSLCIVAIVMPAAGATTQNFVAKTASGYEQGYAAGQPSRSR